MGEWKLIVPEATQNLVENPSFETGTMGWTTGGTNTIAQSSDRQHFGIYSVKCTYQDSVTFVSQTTTSTYADAAHYVTTRVYVPSSYDGGNLRILILSNSDGTETQVTEWESGTSPTDEWFLLETSFVPDTDFTWSVGVVGNGAPSVGEFIYVDGWQVEEKSYYTTYCDGDQDDCSWDGAEHASTSTRLAYGIGGRVRDFEDDLDFATMEMQEVGMPPVSLHFNSQLDRDTLASLRYERRAMRFRSSIIGSSLSNMHSVRQTLVKAFLPNTGKVNERPRLRRLRYTGASDDKEIDVAYDTGLELSDKDGFTDEAQVRFIAPDPMFYQVGESGAELSTTTNISPKLAIAYIEGLWDVLGPPDASGLYSQAYTVLADEENGYVYYGGNFENFDNVANADGVVRYDVAAETWEALGTGTSGTGNSTVYDMALAPNGDLYVTGDFLNMGGVGNADYVAKWDGSSWTALGTGFNALGRAVIVAEDGRVWFGGDFTTANSVTVNYITYWDGSNFNAVDSGPGLDDDVHALNQWPSGLIGVGGKFRAKNGGTAGDFERFAVVGDASDTPIFTGNIGSSTGFNNTVNVIRRVVSGRVWIGGDFTQDSDGNTLRRLGEWTGIGQAAEVAGGVASGSVYSIFPANDGSVWVGFDGSVVIGDLTSISTLARIVSGEWQPVGVNLSSSVATYRFAAYRDDLYVATSENSTATQPTASDLTNITYEGTAPAYPVIKIKRSGGTSAILYEVRNVTTGAVLSFDTYAIQDGETVIIDTRPGHRSIRNNKGESLLGYVQGLSDLGSFYLAPANSGSRTNEIEIFVLENGSPTMTATIRYRVAYISAD